MRFVAAVAIVLTFGVAVSARAEGAGSSSTNGPRPVDFNRDIRPILSNNCYACHGPDSGKRKADPPLRLDTKDGLFGERDGTWPVVPGKTDDSLMVLRITSDDDEFRMPPKKAGKKPLSARQIELITQWVAQGAKWKDHWAYIVPARSEVPQVDVSSSFVKNDIDRFVIEKLHDHSLAPSAEADRATLIRRLSLDLTGLPPSAEEVDAFVADKSPNAYENLVNRLLASPHFGERMAVWWLDLVRYADTIGFHSDNPREVWPFRDYVINAFNQNKPFDQFTTEQLAGDLLPSATREQKVASGYNRLLLTTGEGGAQAAEYIIKYEEDRVRNISTTWMGSTMGCAQCHDHKFDPFSQKDFYRMAAFFADIQEPPISLPQPELLLTTPDQQTELDHLHAAIASTKKSLNTTTPEIAAAQAQWEAKSREALKDDGVTWTPLTIVDASSANGANLPIGEDKQHILVSGNNPDVDTYTIHATTKLNNITALRIEALPHKGLPANGPGRAANGNFVLTELDVQADRGVGPTTQPIAFQAASASFEQTFAGEASPYKRWPAVAAIDGDKFGPKWGWAILDRAGIPNSAVFETAANFGTGEEVALTIALKQNFGDRHTLGHFRLSVTDAPRPVRAKPDSGLPAEIITILKADPEKLTPEQKNALAAHYRSIAPELTPARAELAKLNTDKAALVATVDKTLISVSGKPREVRVLHRGDWQDKTGEVVTPAVPHFMKQVDPGSPDKRATRLDLAHWLIDRDNPLVARVFVNRLWKLFYGAGLCKPLDDIGSQGSPPTHPELLDWLATEFLESGWDVKHVVKLMVLSGTYRQSSNTTPQMREADPDNLWLARQGRFRLDAEFVRDNALSVTGLLVDKIGGPSVKPYQPEGYWDFLNFPKRTYPQDHGEKLYRRGLYTWWQRTFLNPSLRNFDASTREECEAERARSNTPQQALTLLDDPTYVEASRVLAEHIIRACPGDANARLSWAFKRVLAREVRPDEAKVLSALLEKHRAEYANDKNAARALISAGEYRVPADIDPVELATWTSVSRAILNLHETVTRL